MEGDDFLQLLQHSDCLMGNSSVGIRECAYLGVPVINIGSRQNKSDRGQNVMDVGYSKEKIEAVDLVLKKREINFAPIYGGGNAGTPIADLLVQLPLQFHKTIMY